MNKEMTKKVVAQFAITLAAVVGGIYAVKGIDMLYAKFKKK